MAERSETTLFCEQCGKPFHPWKHAFFTSRFCSSTCFGNAHRAPIPTCLHCGEKFKRNHGKNKFCSTRCSARFGRPSVHDRFMSFVEKTDGCWEWRGARHPAGYGVFSINNKAHIATRVAHSLFKGDIPKGMFVCHSCDNPPCVNPDHLWLGDAQDNMSDMVRKGRYKPRSLPCGEKHHAAKITAEDAAYIKSSKESRRSLCKRFGVSIGTISNIRVGNTWAATLGKSHLP